MAATHAPTSLDFTLRFLTKKQVATANALSSLDMQGLTMIALNGKGASAKLAASFAGDNALDKAFEQFQASGCKNVRPLSVLVMSLTGTFTDTKTLPVCPTKRADFLAYPADVKGWALSTDNEKTQSLRLRVFDQVSSIVNRTQSLVDAFYKAQEQETATLAQEQETATLAQEQEAVTLAQEQEAATLAQEQEAVTLAQEQEAATLAQEQETATLAQEQETATLAQEQETATLAQEQEAVTLAQEQEAATV